MKGKYYPGFDKLFFAAIILFLINSCNAPDYSPENNNPRGHQTDEGEREPARKPEREQLKAFVQYSASEGNMQARMAEVALAESEDTIVRNFARKTLEDYKEINKRLGDAAQNFGWDLPRDMFQVHVDLYNEVVYTERDFGKKYLETVIDVQRSSIERLNKMLNMMTDSLPGTETISQPSMRSPVSAGDSSRLVSSDLNNQKELRTPEESSADRRLLADWVRDTLRYLNSQLERSQDIRKRIS